MQASPLRLPGSIVPIFEQFSRAQRFSLCGVRTAVPLCEQKGCLRYPVWKDISIFHMMKDQSLGNVVFR